jgi:hypothetical protein
MNEHRISALAKKIENLRLLRGVTEVDRETKLELSGISYPGGEIGHLVERQLITTECGYGSWDELYNQEVLSAVEEYVDRELQT